MTTTPLDIRYTDSALARPAGSRALWAGRIISTLVVLFLTFDVGIKLLRAPVAIDSTVQLGYPANTVLAIGLIELVCLVLYLVPRTAVIGALLWTGYLGGAIATHVRLENPLFSHVLFPVYVAAMLWGGLWLRDARVRGLFGLRRP